MKKIFHPSDSRGKFDFGWLKTSHSFSFGHYFNPERVNFGMLRVLNDDFVEGGMGFGTHPHKDMEIITIPISGALEHKDSTGGKGVLYPNEVQVMSAGTGIEHSEFNHLKDETSNFLQIWIFPDKKGHQPRYAQKYFDEQERKNKFQFVVTPDKENGNLWINQNAFISLSELEESKELIYNLHSEKNGIYLFLISGELLVEEQLLQKRDAIGIWETNSVKISAIKNSYFLVIEVPME
ncbi:MAG: pirin family protein [Ignavibacterium sp.]|nr:pirin family protein [Ignavibacterium sp.]